MISENLTQILLSVVTITMAITPLLSKLGEVIAEKLEPKEYSQNTLAKEVADLDGHVIIAGFGRVGRMVARLLEAEHVSYIAIDIEQQTVEEAHNEGFPVYLGDGSNIEMLRTLGINRAACIISTVDNEVTMKKALRAIHMELPRLPVIVRAQDLTRAKQLQEIGVTIVVPETYEIGLQLGGAVLKTVGISEFEVSRIKNHFRAGNYVLAKNIDDTFMNEDVIDEIS